MARRSDWAELMLTILWGAEKLLTPSWSTRFQSYEAWERRHGLQHQVERLEQRGLIRKHKRAGELVATITAQGVRAISGGVDLSRHWERDWDGSWRQILFDLPAGDQRLRMRLWRWLRTNRFGYLQRSVWVSPDPLADLEQALQAFSDDVEMMLFMNAQCVRAGRDQQIVQGAWDFKRINDRYNAYLAEAELSREQRAAFRRSPSELARWFRKERSLWEAALALDPLLPRALHPAGYLGPRAWETRRRIYGQLIN